MAHTLVSVPTKVFFFVFVTASSEARILVLVDPESEHQKQLIKSVCLYLPHPHFAGPPSPIPGRIFLETEPEKCSQKGELNISTWCEA